LDWQKLSKSKTKKEIIYEKLGISSLCANHHPNDAKPSSGWVAVCYFIGGDAPMKN
jgi:hypothetical protein